MSGVPGWSRAVILPHQREISPSFCTQRRQFEFLPPWWLALGAPVGCFARRPATENATKSMRVIRLADGAVDPKTGHSSFRRPCFQRGEVREKSQFPAGPTFPPEIWQKDLIEPACLAYVPTLDTFKVGDIEGPARKFRTQAELSRGKNHAQKTMTTYENLLSLAADSGADTNKNHNNQPYKHFHSYLGRVSLHFWVDWAAVALTVSLLE